MYLTGKQYQTVMGWISRRTYGAKLCHILAKGISLLTAGMYGVLLGYLVRTHQNLIPYVVVPAISFLAVTIFRANYSARRPYEIYQFTPLLPKETQGKSFPSRHVFSIFILGTTFFVVSEPLGIVTYALGIVLAVIRVVTGVHFPKDVLVGALLGVFLGAAGYFFLL